MEHSVVVADAVAVSRQLERGHGVEKAGRQTAQPAVAQSRFLLQLPDLLHVVTQLEQRLLALLVELKVDQAVAERASDQVFERQVVDSLEVRILVVGPPCRDPAFDEPVAHHPRQRDVQVRLGRMARDLGLGECHVIQERALERPHVQAQTLAHACRRLGRDSAPRGSCWSVRGVRASSTPEVLIGDIGDGVEAQLSGQGRARRAFAPRGEGFPGTPKLAGRRLGVIPPMRGPSQADSELRR